MPRLSLVILLLGSLLTIGACSKDEAATEEQRQEVIAAVDAYLQDLSDAYRQLDASVLEDTAAIGEIFEVRKLLTNIRASGSRLETVLLEREIEEVVFFRQSLARVELIEVWDVRRLDFYSGRELGRNPTSVQNAQINLSLIDGKWMVTARMVVETTTPSEAYFTPTPDLPDEETESGSIDENAESGDANDEVGYELEEIG